MYKKLCFCLMGLSLIGALPAQAQTTNIKTEGRASYIGKQFHGRATASGEVLDNTQMVAAHRKLPFGTLVKVTNIKNQASVIVRIIDRGPFRSQRIIDLSQGAFAKLAPLRQGVIRVKIEVQSPQNVLRRQVAELDVDALLLLPASARLSDNAARSLEYTTP